MHDFERDLGQAETTIARSEPHIRRTLQNLNLDTSRLNAIRELGNWISAKRPELRRRNETIQAVTTTWGTAAPGTMQPLDEALYTRASGNADAYAAAGALTGLDHTATVDEKTIAELEKRAGDADFATSLMHALGTERFRHLMSALTYTKDPGKQRLQAAVGKALGAASTRLSTSWRQELLAHLRVPVDQHALAELLPHGRFDRDFLVATAKALEALDRKTWKDAGGTPHDPMIGVMKALANDPKAAQDFFIGDPSVMERYVTQRPMDDEGAAFGKALEAATMTYRDRDGGPEAPSPGFASAQIAYDFIHWEAQRILADTDGPSFATNGTTTRILAAYINDVNRAARLPHTGNSKVFVATREHQSASDQVWGAQFNKEDLRKVMQDLFGNDPKALAALTAAQTAWSRKILDFGAAQAASGKGSEALLANMREAGAGFGLITDATGLAKIQQGKELDEAQERNMKILMAVVNTGLAIPQTAAAAITAGTVGAWTSMIEDSAKTEKNADMATYDANTADGKAKFLLDQLAADAMLRHGLFGRADPAAPTHPWGSLEALERGEDPRKSPNDFLKDDGESLMTLNEMTPYEGVAQPRLDAYNRWLYEGLAGEQWIPVSQAADDGFNYGKSEFK
uniref:DUF6571 family protein n=1 Tax=Nonomuraea pusilla TaxID=46177 RepID=UPI0006E32BE9|nr:DUF6571 family protein [Nonomuraea pusilla]